MNLIDPKKVNVLHLPRKIRQEYEEDPEGFRERRVRNMREIMRRIIEQNSSRRNDAIRRMVRHEKSFSSCY